MYVMHVFRTGQKGLALAGIHRCVWILYTCEIYWKQHSVQVGVWFSLHGAGENHCVFANLQEEAPQIRVDQAAIK
jgi:hypothetical protein